MRGDNNDFDKFEDGARSLIGTLSTIQTARDEIQEVVLETVKVTRVYGFGSGNETHALDGVSFRVNKGDFVAIVGPSGSGKSTLLNVVGALDRPTSGGVMIDGVDISRLSSKELARVRNEKIGFVFQSFNLISRITAFANVELPLLVTGISPKERKRRALALMRQFGIESKANRRPTELSGGEQQRVALARALVTDPLILLADEPTGNLDTKNAELVMDIFTELNEKGGKTIVVITHSPEVAARTKKIIYVRDGMIEGTKEN